MSDSPVYHSDSGITEGDAPVPRWYLGKYLVDAQMSTARMKDDPPAAAPVPPGDGAADGAADDAADGATDGA